jgi:RNA 2',3'-cyclic 3'-phosphodiesterase
MARSTTRSFVALVLDAPTRAAVDAEIERLRPLSRAVAWVPAPNLHLTLKFLGEQSDAALALAAEALDAAGAATAPFAVTLFGLGAFPGMERPRIFWVGVAEGGLEIRALQSRLEDGLERRGFARESRPWHPHLTIGRVFDPRRWGRDTSPALRAAIARAATTGFGAVPLTRVVLMRSDLSASGARYRELHSAPLSAAAR